MLSTIISRNLRRGAMALALAACAGLASAAGTAHVQFDTSSFADSGGFLDLQFNPSGTDAPAASISLSHFTGFDASVMASHDGDVTGSLATGYTIGNSTAWNDLFQAVHFGGTVSFDVTFNGAADLSGNVHQSVFGVALYGADGMTALGNPAANGNLVELTWTAATAVGQQGGVTSVVFDNAAASVSVSTVPEPSTWLMLGAGLALVGVAGTKRRKPVAVDLALAA